MDDTLDPKMAVALFRYEAIAAYLAADPPRGQRRPLLAQLAARTWTDPLGRPHSIAAETLRTWVRRYRKKGLQDRADQARSAFPFRQASASELGARQSHKSHEQTDDGNEHRDPSPEPHDLRLQIHCLHVQHVAAHHVSVFTPEPAPGRRAGHAQARGDARVARGSHEFSQPMVVDVLSLFHATHHRRARVGGNFPVVMVAASSLTRTRASKSRLSWLTAARFVFGTGRGSGTEHRRSAIVGRFAGWPRAVACPGLPQIRTCAIDASGSLVQGLATR